MVTLKFLKAYRFLCYETLALIGLGGSVRVFNAGLACPDWPLCFGRFIPDFHIQVYLEFLHRVLAGSLGLLVFFFGIYLVLNRTTQKLVKLLSIIAMMTVVAQIFIGGLTVLLLLKEGIVALHLFCAILLFACLLLTYWELREEHIPTEFVGSPNWIKGMSYLVTVVIWLQMLMGGLVASHYAGLVCPDFPLCLGQWFPTLHGSIGLHVLHRGWAYMCVLLVLGLRWSIKVGLPAHHVLVTKWSRRLVMGIWFQLGLGIANIFFKTPPLIVVLHLLTGTLLFGISLRLSYLLGRGEESAENGLLLTVPNQSLN